MNRAPGETLLHDLITTDCDIKQVLFPYLNRYLTVGENLLMVLCMPIFVKVGTPHNYAAYAASETSENACKAYTIRDL